jgi:outer membrane protein assembly factor BamB
VRAYPARRLAHSLGRGAAWLLAAVRSLIGRVARLAAAFTVALSVPALSVSGLSVPALSVPALSIPALSVPALPVSGLLVSGLSLSVLVGAAAGADVAYPLAVASAADGPVYLADRDLPGVWKIADGKLTLFFQASKKFRTPLNAVRCLAFDAEGKLLAGDSSTRDVYRFNDAGQPVPLTKGGIGIPMAIAVAKSGDLVVADLELHCLWKVPAAGGTAIKLKEVPAPRGVAIDSDERVWIVSHGSDQVLRLNQDGSIETIVKGRPFQFPHQIVVADDNTAFVTDGYAKTVWKIVAGAEPQKLCAGEPLVNPVGLARRGDRLLVADPRAKAVFQIDATGKIEPLPAAP